MEKLHPFHTHLLLYYGCYDSKQVLYTLETLRNLMPGTRSFSSVSQSTRRFPSRS
jgi:hypothetical protein